MNEKMCGVAPNMTDRPQTQMEEALAELREELDRAAKMQHNVAGRLSAALVDTDMAKGEGCGVPIQTTAPLVSEVRDAARRLSSITDAHGDVLARLQI